MSTTVGCFADEDDFKEVRERKKSTLKKCYSTGGPILKAKENLIKSKSRCDKSLKNKLKKYKLRKDGKEDPEVINVSQCLSSSLKIKSPKNQVNNKTVEKLSPQHETVKITNYLVKMPKLRDNIDPDESKKIKVELKENNKDVLKVESEVISKISPTMNKELLSKSPVNNNFGVLCSVTAHVGAEIKQMNAFQLMMNARNKSIGCNSPGKDKPVLEIELDDMIHQKEVKVKRMLALEKMAEAKGSLKTKQLEDLKDVTIKKKLDARAERLKHLITKNKDKSAEKKSKIHKVIKRRRTSDTDEKSKKVKVDCCDQKPVFEILKHTKTAESLSIYKPVSPKDPSLQKITKEDKMFLDKLAPSIKKKENMLSYFQKIDNGCLSADDNSNNMDINEFNESNVLIKVKFTPRKKKKSGKIKRKSGTCNDLDNKQKFNSDVIGEKKSINSEKLETPQDNIEVVPAIGLNGKVGKKSSKKAKFVNQVIEEKKDIQNKTIHIPQNNIPLVPVTVLNGTGTSSKNTKCINQRINKDNKESKITSFTASSQTCNVNDSRPKRTIKKPPKYEYLDPLSTSSSEDEQIFTPKKKRGKNEKNLSITNLDKTPSKSFNSLGVNTKGSKDIRSAMQNKSKKIAPIFSSKPQIDKASIEAKQKFLQSGVPDQLKKIMARQKSVNEETEYFQTITHVQQKNTDSALINPWLLQEVDLNLIKLDEEPSVVIKNPFKLISLITLNRQECNTKEPQCNNFDCKQMLSKIKLSYPKFPVYRTYRLLKNKYSLKSKELCIQESLDNLDSSIEILSGLSDTTCNDPDILSWTEKYRATSSEDIIGNFDSTKTLKKWLTNWKENEAVALSQPIRLNEDSSDSSDFYPSDSDSKDNSKTFNNLFILIGPVGSGKTSAVYAVATELAIKVIEVNASTKRTGKKMLLDLQEATQSHKVNRGKSLTQSQNSQEYGMYDAPKVRLLGKKRDKKLLTNKKSYSQPEESSGTNHSDMNRTAMSLILIDDADLVFEQDEGFTSALAQIVQSSKRPVIIVASTINSQHLQKFAHCENIVNFNPLCPRMLGTWLDVMCLVENDGHQQNAGSYLLDYFKGDIRKTINSLNFWVSSEKLLKKKSDSQTQDKFSLDAEEESSLSSWGIQESPSDQNIVDSGVGLNHKKHVNFFKSFTTLVDCEIYKFDNILLQFPVDTLSLWWNIPDLLKIAYEPVKKDKKTRNTELEELKNLLNAVSTVDMISKKKCPSVKKSVISNPWMFSESNSVSESEDLSCYDSSTELGDSISYTLIRLSIDEAQKSFKTFGDSTLFNNLTSPGVDVQRERDKTVAGHNALNSAFSPSSILDRRGLALDYFSVCRSICRIEKEKVDNNSKRNNRFCHYMKSLKVSSKCEALEKLCDSLSATT